MLFYTIVIWIVFLLILQYTLYYVRVQESYINLELLPQEVRKNYEIAMGISKSIVPDYSPKNYDISRKSIKYGSDYFGAGTDTHLVWNKPSEFKKPLIIPSLVSLKFADNNKTLREIIKGEKRNIVQECTDKRTNDTKRINRALQKVNRQIVLHDTLVMISNIRKKIIQDRYNSYIASQPKLSKLLQIQCYMTADNSIMECWYNNTKMSFDTINGQNPDNSDWTKPKSFKITNFKNGKVFACKCANKESAESVNDSHQYSAGLIIISDTQNIRKESNMVAFSTDISDKNVKKNWKVFSSNNPDALPPNDWYKKDYNDNHWKEPVGSSSGFQLNIPGTAPITDNNKKIWGGQKQNKYVWFRYKQR